MLAGVKPAAFMDVKEVSTSMQGAIDNGSIVKIGESHFLRKDRIYCDPSDIDDAKKAASILGNMHQGSFPSVEDTNFVNGFFAPARQIDIDWQGPYKKNNPKVKIETSLQRGIKTPAVHALINGDVKVIDPVFIGSMKVEDISGQYEEDLKGGIKDEDLEAAVKAGRLAKVDIETRSTTAVFAQASKTEEGRELFDRYYGSDEKSEDLEYEEWHARIGQLLGFTKEDVDHFLGRGIYTTPVLKPLMDNTINFRSWARKEYMLMCAEDNKLSAEI